VTISLNGYVKAYGECVLADVVPIFDTLSQRADEIADAEFKRLGSLPDGEDCDGDMGDLAEAAQDKGQVFYDTMIAIRQTTLNLFAAGLFHLLEQQLADLCRDGAFHVPPPSDTKLKVVATWYREYFDLDLTSLPSWPMIEQLRLISNSVKHGEGGSAAKLRALRPDLFQDPRLRTLFPDFEELLSGSPLHNPMAGEDFFLTAEAFAEFNRAAVSFISEVAGYFADHSEEHYLVGS
jgi:hypothetical protein